MKPMLLTLVIVSIMAGAIYYDYWEDINNKNNWEQLPIYNIRIKGDSWQALDIQLPPQLNVAYNVMEYEVAIPHRYRLEREHYVIDIEVNPTGHSLQANLQILTTHNSGSHKLRVESSWEGNCGSIGKASKKKSWGTRTDKIETLGSPFLTDPKAIAFVWRRYTGDCTKDALETIEFASFFPIILKIYDGLDLLGEEQIDFEIFKNGVRKYLVMP